MQLGISTSCFYPLPTEQAVDWLCTHGAENVEVFFNTVGEAAPQKLHPMKDVLEATGVRVISVHPFLSALEPMLFFSEYSRRFEEGLELYRQFYEAAATLGARFLVFHGDRLGSALPEEESFSRFAALAELGRSFGVVLAQENTVRTRSRDPGFLLRMKAALGELAAFTLDVKQARRSGYRAEDFLAPLGSAVRHIHLSDADGQQDCLPVCEGSEEILRLLTNLKALNFDGGVILELYRENYGQYEELTQSLAYTHTLAKKAGVSC